MQRQQFPINYSTLPLYLANETASAVQVAGETTINCELGGGGGYVAEFAHLQFE